VIALVKWNPPLEWKDELTTPALEEGMFFWVIGDTRTDEEVLEDKTRQLEIW
jgi:hypothetical protein